MPSITYSFTVEAHQPSVVAFHHNTSVLRRLTSPPMIAQIHSFEPLDEGSEANFTLWLGPVPIHWKSIHSDVDGSGFTDTQVRGPLEKWVHRQTFTPINDERTLVSEHIEYEHKTSPAGALTRMLFSTTSPEMLFTYRKLVTKRTAELSTRLP